MTDLSVAVLMQLYHQVLHIKLLDTPRQDLFNSDVKNNTNHKQENPFYASIIEYSDDYIDRIMYLINSLAAIGVHIFN